jgi:hypothetical protein
MPIIYHEYLGHMSPCAAKIWDYASPIMLLKIAIMLLSILKLSLLFYTSLAN